MTTGSKIWNCVLCFFILYILLLLFSHSVLSDSLWPPWTAACQASLSFISSWSLLRLMSVESVMPSNHLILCHPLLLLPSIFPSIRVCSNELAPRLRWPKYWRFSFSISPSSEYSGLISFRIGWFDTGFLHGACLRHVCSFSFNFKNHKKKNPIDLEVVSHPRGLGCRIVSPT